MKKRTVRPVFWKKWILGLVGSGVIVLGGVNSFMNNNNISVLKVEDGDTVTLSSGKTVRIIGINAPEIGEKNYEQAKGYLAYLVMNKQVWIEQDRYLQDRYGRELVWLWVGCEGETKFMANDYMVKNDGSHNTPLADNPVGCKKGKLVSEEMVKEGFAKVYFLSQKGEMKYEERLSKIGK